MSEVHRYNVVTMLSAAGATIGYDPHGPEVVMASAFDEATRLFLDAAERCVAAERREKELQQRLTASDERADLLEGLLLQTNELLYAIQGDPGAVPSSAIDAMRGEVFTALKPAEGSTCNQIREESGLTVNTPCQACGHGACIDR